MTDDPSSVFRQKPQNVMPRGSQGGAVDPSPSPLSGEGGRTTVTRPVWEQFSQNEYLRENNRQAVRAETQLQDRAARHNAGLAKQSATESMAEKWGGENGRLFRKIGSQIEEHDAEQFGDDPVAGPFARKSVWDRDLKKTKAEAEAARLEMEGLSFSELPASKRQEIEIEMQGYDLATQLGQNYEADPKYSALKQQLVADTEARERRAALERQAYDAKVRAFQIEQAGPDGWWEARRNQPKPDPRREAVAGAQAEREQATQADESALEEETQIRERMRGGVTAAEAAQLQERLQQINQVREQASNVRMGAEDRISGVQQQAQEQSRGFLGNEIAALKRGYAGAAQAANILQGATDATNAQDIVNNEALKRANPASKEFQEFMQAEGFMASAKAFIKNPVQIVTEVLLESAAQMVPGIALGAVGGTIGGAVSSAPTAGVAAPATVPLGAVIGSAIGAGSGSALAEYGSAMMDAMVEAGMDATSPESIQAFFSDPEKLAKAKEFAVARGVTIGAFDAVSAGLAGKFLKPVMTASKAGQKVGVGQVLAASGKEVGAQALAGAGGEAAGQFASEGTISDGKAIFLEGIAEIGSAPVEVATNVRDFNRQQAQNNAQPPAADPTDPELVNTALLGIDPEASEAAETEIEMARLMTNQNEGPQGIAESVMVLRELQEIEAEDEQTRADFEEAVEAVKASGGDSKAIKQAEEQAEAAKVGRAATVRGVLRIAAGADITDLTVEELRGLGMEPGKNGGFKPIKDAPQMVREGADGSVVLTDIAIKTVEQASPRARAKIKLTEAQALERAKQRLLTDTQNGMPGDPAATGQETGAGGETNAAVGTFEVTTRSGRKIQVQAATAQQAEEQAAAMADFGDPIQPSMTRQISQPQQAPTNEQASQPQAESPPAQPDQPGQAGTPQGAAGGTGQPVGGQSATATGADAEGTPVGTTTANPKETRAKAIKDFKAVIARHKTSKKLAGRIKLVSGKKTTGATWDGDININVDERVDQLLKSGMSVEDAVKAFERVIDEEIRHSAHMDAAVKLYRVNGFGMEFNEWFDQHYGERIWKGEFGGNTGEKGQAVRSIYTGTSKQAQERWDEMTAEQKAANADNPIYSGLTLWDSMSDANRAMEGIRIMSQPAVTEEAWVLWSNLGKYTKQVLKTALDVMKAFVKGVKDENISPILKAEIQHLEDALARLTAEDSQSRPGTAPTGGKKPAESKPGAGTGSKPGPSASGGKAASDGKAEPAGRPAAGASLAAGTRVEFDAHDGRPGGTGVIRIANERTASIYPDSNPGEAIGPIPLEKVRVMDTKPQAKPEPAAETPAPAEPATSAPEPTPQPAPDANTPKLSPAKEKARKVLDGLFAAPMPVSEMPEPPPGNAWSRAMERFESETGSKSRLGKRDRWTELAEEEEAVDAEYEKRLQEWLDTVPERQPISFVTENDRGPVYAVVTRNSTDPQKPWRATFFDTLPRPGWTQEEELEYDELFKKTRWHSAGSHPDYYKWWDRLGELGSRPVPPGSTRISPYGHEELKTRLEAVLTAMRHRDNPTVKVGSLFAAKIPESYTKPIPQDRLAALMDAAQSLVQEGVNTPETLAEAMKELAPDNKALPFTQSFWFAMKAVGAEGAAEPDWSAIYEGLEASTNKNRDWTTLTEEELPRLNSDLEGYGQWRRQIADKVIPNSTQIQREALAMELANAVAEEMRKPGVESWQHHIIAQNTAAKLIAGERQDILDKAKDRALSDEYAQWQMGRKFEGEPISVEAFDKHSKGAPLPEGYVRKGDFYENPAPTQVDNASPDQDAGMDALKKRLVEIDAELVRLDEKGKKLLAKHAKQPIVPPSIKADAFKNGVTKPMDRLDAEKAEILAKLNQSKSEPSPPAIEEVKAPAKETKAAKAVAKKPETNTKKLKAQKEYLLAALDKAIEEAPDTKAFGFDLTPEGKEDMGKAGMSKFGISKEDMEALYSKYDVKPDGDVFSDKNKGPLYTAIRQQTYTRPEKLIEISVPGDGTFRIVNDKRTLQDFRKQANTRFPTTAAQSNEAKATTPRETAITKLGSPETNKDYVAVAGMFVSDDERRWVINHVHSDGENVVATDGKRMLILKRNIAGTKDKPMHFDGKTQKPVKFDEEDKYPDWRQVVPKDLPDRVEIDTSAVQKIAIQAKSMATSAAGDKENGRTLIIWKDANGKLGYTLDNTAGGHPTEGAYEAGLFAGGDADPETAKKVLALNVYRFLDGLKALRMLGHEKATLHTDGAENPMMLTADGVQYVLMPVKNEQSDMHPLSEAYEAKMGEEAEIARQAELEAAAAEREKMKAEREAKERERIAKIVGDQEPEAKPEEKQAPEAPAETATTIAERQYRERLQDFQAGGQADINRATDNARVGKFLDYTPDRIFTDLVNSGVAERIAEYAVERNFAGWNAPAPKSENFDSDFNIGDNVTFTPNDEIGKVVSGILQDKIKNQSGGVGYHIFSPTESNPYQVIRVWASDGELTATPQEPAPKQETPDNPRATLGESVIGPFVGFSHGDVFRDKGGKRWVLGGGDTWTLYAEGDTNKPDYTKPHPKIVNIASANELRSIINRMADEAEEAPATPAKPAITQSKPGEIEYRGFKITKSEGVQLGYTTNTGKSGKGRKSSGYEIADDEGTTIKFVDTLKDAKAYVDQYMGDTPEVTTPAATDDSPLRVFIKQFLAKSLAVSEMADMPQRVLRLSNSQKETKAVAEMVRAEGMKDTDGTLFKGTEHYRAYQELMKTLQYMERKRIGEDVATTPDTAVSQAGLAGARPYFGRDVDKVMDEVSESYRKWERELPQPDFDGFNIKVNPYGVLWAQASQVRLGGYPVVAGVTGNMSGVTVGLFRTKEAADAYYADFREGKVFALMNGELWLKFVNAANAVKTMDSAHMQFLRSLARTEGINDKGETLKAKDLVAHYEGLSVKESAKFSVEPTPDTAVESTADIETFSPEQAASELAKRGITLEKEATKTGKAVWRIKGKTFDVKDALKDLGAKWYAPAKAWSIFSDEDPTQKIANALAGKPAPESQSGSTQDDSGASNDPDEDARLRELRERLDGSSDERRDRGDAISSVDAGTAALIRRGLKFGMPAEVVEDQIEDIAMITAAFQAGKPAFILGNGAGTGKTFVLGGAIREMRAKGAKSFVYVTMNQDLIEQIKADLADFGVSDVKFHTYSEMSTKPIPMEKDAVLIFDEAHNVKNEQAARGEKSQPMMANAKFTIFASATPFENPVQAAYLGGTGLFNEAGGHVEWGKAYGASVKRRKFFNPQTGQEQIEETLYWRGGKLEDGLAARQWFVRQGIMVTRPMRLPMEMVESTFTKFKAADQWVTLYDRVTAAYDDAMAKYRNEDGSIRDARENSQVSMHMTNTVKRILEASKVEHAVSEAKRILADTDAKGSPNNVVIFVETKADRWLGRYKTGEAYQKENGRDSKHYTFPEMAEMMDSWKREAAIKRKYGERPGPSPFAPFIMDIAKAMYEADIEIQLPSVEDEIVGALGGADKVGVYTGSVTGAKAKADKEAFLRGEKRVIVATMAKGGTGLSLHDKVGNRPTVQININLPWVATGVDQVSGRVARYGLQSKAFINWLFADNIAFERMLANRVGRRMRDMGALVKGIDMKAAKVLTDDFDFEGSADVKQTDGEVEVAESDIFEQAERLEKNRRQKGDQSHGFFETPLSLAALMTQISGARGKLLEPSAGRGNLIRFAKGSKNLRSITAVEFRQDNADYLKGQGYNVTNADFLEVADTLGLFNTIHMNPPFERKAGTGWQDMAHVMKAFSLLTPDGRLVAIVGEGGFFRSDKQSQEFRQFLSDKGAVVIKLPEGAFKNSGTGVRTRMLVIDQNVEAGRTDIDLSDIDPDTLRSVADAVPARRGDSSLRAAPLPPRVTPRDPEWKNLTREQRVEAVKAIRGDRDNAKPHFAELSELEMTDWPFSATYQGQQVEVLGPASDFDPNVLKGILKPDSTPDRFRWWTIETKGGKKQTVSVHSLTKHGKPLLPRPKSAPNVTEIPSRNLVKDTLRAAPMPKDADEGPELFQRRANAKVQAAQPKLDMAREQAKEYGPGSIGVDPTFSNPGSTTESRVERDIIRAYDLHTRTVRNDRDVMAKGREYLEKYPEDVERLLLENAFSDRGGDSVADYKQHAINLLLDRKTREAVASGDPKRMAEITALHFADIAVGRETARSLRMRMDRFMTPAERAEQAIAGAIFKPSQKVEARTRLLPPRERKAYLEKAAEQRIKEVEAELAKLGLRIEQVLGKNRDLQLENSRLVKEVLKKQNLLDQGVVKMVQKGATIADIKRRYGKEAAEKAQETVTKTREEIAKQLRQMLESGMTREQIRETMKDTLKAAPVPGGDSGKTPDIDAMIEAMLVEDFGLPAVVPAKRVLPRTKKPKTPDVSESHPLSSDWSRPEFTDGLKSYEFDTKDRAGIMERVEIIRGLAGAVGKIDSLKGKQREQAERMVKEIDSILAKYGTDSRGIFDAGKGIEDYRFDIEDIAQVAAVSRAISQIDADVVDKATEWFYASMLSGLQTMLVNATAILPAAWEMTVGRGLDLAINSFVKDPMSAQYGEARYIMRAMKPALIRALSNFQASMAAQHPMFDRDVNAMEVDWDKILGGGSHRMIGSISGKKGDWARIPRRLLTATDDFNRTLIACAEVGAYAYRLAKAKGLQPGSPEFDTFVKKEVNTPGSFSYHMASQKASNYIYSNPLPGQRDPHAEGENKTVPVRDIGDLAGFVAGRITDAIAKEHHNLAVKGLAAMLRVSFFPFQRTPFNIIRKGMRHTLNPVSLIDIALGIADNSFVKNDATGKREFKWNAKGRNPELITRIGQQLQGTVLLMMLAATAAGEGDEDDLDKPFVITGSAPFTPQGRAERDARMRSGVGPFRISFRRKDGSERFGFNYGRIEPLATTLSATIDTIKSFKRSWRAGQTNQQALEAAMGGLVAQAQDKTFMRGVNDLIALTTNVLASPDLQENRKFHQFLAGRIAMVVPNIIKQPIREGDTMFRERSNGFMEELLYQVAPTGQKPAKVDPYGREGRKPVLMDGGLADSVARSVDIADTGTDKVHPVDRMLIKWRDSGKWAKAADPNDRKPWFPSPILKAEFKHRRTGQNVEMDAAQLKEFREMAGKRTLALLKLNRINYDSPTERDVEAVKNAVSKARTDAKTILSIKYSR